MVEECFLPIVMGTKQRLIFPTTVVASVTKIPEEGILPKDMPVVGGRLMVAAFWAPLWQIVLVCLASQIIMLYRLRRIADCHDFLYMPRSRSCRR